jgi:hypothetical protein
MAILQNPTPNTLNQRASRERRRAYIQDLERKVRAYEAREVHATTEVQVAARKVATENRILKDEVGVLRQKCEILEQKIWMLTSGAGADAGRHSGSASTVAEEPKHDHRHGDGQMSFIASTTNSSLPAFPASDTLSAAPRTIDPSNAAPWDALLTESEGHTPSWLADTSLLGHDSLPSKSQSSFLSSEDGTSSSPFTDCPFPSVSPNHARHSGSPASATCSSVTTPNITPCLQAALIIASMRGVPSTDESTIELEILPELGCVGPLERPTCTPSREGEQGCVRHKNHGELGSLGGGIVSSVTLAETTKCAVDNGRLFSILAQES